MRFYEIFGISSTKNVICNNLFRIFYLGLQNQRYFSDHRDSSEPDALARGTPDTEFRKHLRLWYRVFCAVDGPANLGQNCKSSPGRSWTPTNWRPEWMRKADYVRISSAGGGTVGRSAWIASPLVVARVALVEIAAAANDRKGCLSCK